MMDSVVLNRARLNALLLILSIAIIGALVTYNYSTDDEPDLSDQTTQTRALSLQKSQIAAKTVDTSNPEDGDVVDNAAEETALEDTYTDLLNEFPKTLTVDFPGGQSANVEYKLMNMYFLPRMTTQNLEAYIGLILEIAEKKENPAAAEAAFDLLNDCAAAPRDLNQYHGALDNLEQNGVYFEPALGKEIQLKAGSANYLSAQRFLSSTFRMCKNVTDTQIEQRAQWRDVALELGGYEALVEKTQNYDAENARSERFAAFQRGWDQGYLGFSSGLATEYFRGAAAGLDGRPDYIKAYAYHLAHNTVRSRILMQSGSPDASSRVTSMDQALTQSASYLTPEQHVEAEALAVKLIQENKNCCIGVWPTASQ